MSYGIEEDSNGLYGVCVFNADTSTDDEVLNTFEKFGPIANWNRAKNLFFIRYSTLEEAVHCFKEMKGHSQFSVKAARKKTNGDNKPDNQRRRDRLGDDNNYRKNESGNSNRTSNNMRSPMKPMPKLKFDVPQSELLTATATGSVIKLYHRVIVAHLHPHMTQGDVYNLCTKAQDPPCPPAHIDMKTFTRPPYSPKYYAIVYVMNAADVRHIVRGLNKLKINGYQLVVAPYEELVKEGKTCQSL